MTEARPPNAELWVASGSMPVGERDVRRLTITLLSAVAVLVAYWALWSLDRSAVASAHGHAYYEFEDAFPLADAWLGSCALLAVRAARLGHPTALLWTLCGGGAGVYLVCMDVLYDLGHGIYTSGGGGVIELCINLITVGVSVWTLRWGWTHRLALLAWTAPDAGRQGGSPTGRASAPERPPAAS